MRRTLLPVLVLCAGLFGCDDDEDVPPQTPPRGTEAPGAGGPAVPDPGGEAAAPEAAAEVDDPTFSLRATAAGPYRPGELAQFAIALTPRGEYHVNEEYPITIELTGPAAVAFAKTSLEREDAAEFGETVARFDVPFTPSAAGQHRIQAKVSFAVCTPENCVPDERTLAVLLPVE